MGETFYTDAFIDAFGDNVVLREWAEYYVDLTKLYTNAKLDTLNGIEGVNVQHIAYLLDQMALVPLNAAHRFGRENG